jgi:glycosyltransferase involved in cell wall biosynthesis
MNIWVINYFAGSPSSGWGERHFYLSREWLKNGYNVTIISSSYNHMFSHYAGGKKQFSFEEIEERLFCWIRTPKYNPRSVMRFWAMIVFALKAFFVPAGKAGRPDIIIVSSMPIFSVLTGWLLKKRYRARKFIFEIRDLWPLTPIYLMGYKRHHPFIMFMSWLEKLGYRKSDHIVSVLPNSASYIDAISGSPGKFNYIPNGISQDLVENIPVPGEIEEYLPKGKFIVGYAGTIGLANALEHLAEAARILSGNDHIHFLLTGDGYLKKELEKQTMDLNNITFVPKMSKLYMQGLLRYCDICFIGRNGSPLFDYGVSSNKYFDYMLAGKPILVSSNRIKDPVELSGCGIIVRPDNANEIVKGILEMYSMTPEERNEMGARGHEYVLQYHDFTYLSQKFERLFN